MGIVIFQARQPATQVAGHGHEQAGVAFAHLALFPRRIFLFNDAINAAGVVAQHAAIAFGVGQQHRQQRQLALATCGQQGVQGDGTDERHVAIEHQHAMVVGNVRQALHDGMASAQLFRLQRPLHGLVLQYGLDAVSAVPVDHMDTHGPQFAGAVDDVLQQGLASQRL